MRQILELLRTDLIHSIQILVPQNARLNLRASFSLNDVLFRDDTPTPAPMTGNAPSHNKAQDQEILNDPFRAR